jgi:electron transport complex protein RnfD
MRFDQPTAPHARPLVSVPVVMRRVLYALVPAMLCHTWYFGPGLLLNFALTASAVAHEATVWCRPPDALRAAHQRPVTLPPRPLPPFVLF